jgi:hypothetical protein
MFVRSPTAASPVIAATAFTGRRSAGESRLSHLQSWWRARSRPPQRIADIGWPYDASLERDRTTAANERAWPKNARGSADFFAGASADAGNDGRLFALVVVSNCSTVVMSTIRTRRAGGRAGLRPLNQGVTWRRHLTAEWRGRPRPAAPARPAASRPRCDGNTSALASARRRTPDSRPKRSPRCSCSSRSEGPQVPR